MSRNLKKTHILTFFEKHFFINIFELIKIKNIKNN